VQDGRIANVRNFRVGVLDAQAQSRVEPCKASSDFRAVQDERRTDGARVWADRRFGSPPLSLYIYTGIHIAIVIRHTTTPPSLLRDTLTSSLHLYLAGTLATSLPQLPPSVSVGKQFLLDHATGAQD
jgi:hypothetical protein